MNPILTLISRHKSFVLAFNAAILVLTMGKLVFSPQKWTAKAQLMLPSSASNLDANLGNLGSLKSNDVNFASTVNPLKAQQSILLSSPVIETVYNNDPEKEEFELFSNYQKLFNTAIADKSNTLDLSVIASDPELARQRTLSWIQAYQQRLNQLRQNDLQSRATFNEEQINNAREELNQAEQKLAQWRKNSGLVDGEEQTKNLVKIIGDLTFLQKQAQAQAQANQEQIAIISERLKLTPQQAVTSLGLAEDQEYQFIQNELVKVETSLAELQGNLTDSQPRVQDLLSTKAELERKLEQHLSITEGRSQLIQHLVLLESEVKANEAQAKQYERQIAEITTNLELIPESQSELGKLQREKNIAEGIYQGLVAQVQQVSINSFNSYPNLQIIDPPKTDSTPYSPNKQVILASLLLASLLGSTAIIFLLENQNPLLEPKDLRTSQFGIVVCIPRFKAATSAFDFPDYVQVEFEKLASVISKQAQQDKRFLITSAIQGEGKTTTTIGLAKALSKLGFNVLMVDADYRQSGLTKRMGLATKNNERYPVVVDEKIDLLVASPQPEKAAALVSQGYFEEKIIKAVSFGKYDYILIDSSPVSLTSETVMMSSIVTNTLFVVRPGISPKDVVQSSLNQLRRYGGNNLGLVVNDVKGNNSQVSAAQNYYLNYSTNLERDRSLVKHNGNHNNYNNNLAHNNSDPQNSNDRGVITVQ